MWLRQAQPPKLTLRESEGFFVVSSATLRLRFVIYFVTGKNS